MIKNNANLYISKCRDVMDESIKGKKSAVNTSDENILYTVMRFRGKADDA